MDFTVMCRPRLVLTDNDALRQYDNNGRFSDFVEKYTAYRQD